VRDGQESGRSRDLGRLGVDRHAVLAYREANPSITRTNMIKPETAHPAFAKAGHLFGVDMKIAPVDPVTLQVDLDWVRANIDANTVALIGSAPNYAMARSIRSPSSARSRWNAGSDSTSTGASADSSSPSARARLRHSGVRFLGARRHDHLSGHA